MSTRDCRLRKNPLLQAQQTQIDLCILSSFSSFLISIDKKSLLKSLYVKNYTVLLQYAQLFRLVFNMHLFLGAHIQTVTFNVGPNIILEAKTKTPDSVCNIT